MKYNIILLVAIITLPGHPLLRSQDKAISPSIFITGEYLGETPPLKDLPTLSDNGWQQKVENAEREMGSNRDTRAPVMNFNGQDSPYYPPDANGTTGSNHYMQTINKVFAIYTKSGVLVAGPTALNILFSGLPGAEYNDGDPIVLYDDQADRWLVSELSFSGSNDYVLMAVSTTNDPTGSWYKYSFDVDDVPEYEKFGIWQDGYYMGTNNSSGNDIYVFERSKMLIGKTAQSVGFNNPWRPTTIGGFMCVPPLDNDGDFAPAGEPGLFITINDDAIGGGSDELWIYELDVDWVTPANSLFNRTQQLAVAPFDSDFGDTYENIKQLGTTRELDAMPQVIMNPPQYRNFGSYETILCCHTVDVDNTDHAGIRWYELRRISSGDWTIRQNGTYAPDGHSRWMGSIMLNSSNEIGLGYSISSSTMYPGIRYCGQSATAYAAATGILDIAEEIIQTGAYSQTASNRWGDCSALQIDPVDEHTFWFTTEYIESGGARKTKIASFTLSPVPLTANFTANHTTPQINATVNLTDISLGSPVSWDWSITPGTYIYLGETSASSQHPQVQFTAGGSYSITLTVSDGMDNDSETQANYIIAVDCNNISMPFTEDFSDSALPSCWLIADNQGNGQVWQFNNPGGVVVNTATSANGFAILDSYYYGNGNSQNADLVSPVLDFSIYGTVNLSFQHYFRSLSGSSATLSYSINGETNWTTIQTWTATTLNAATFNQDMSSLVAGHPNVRFKWNYIGSYGYYWAVDDINITGTPAEQWTGGSSADWNTASNWSSGSVPSGTTVVVIPSTSTNWPVFTGDFTLGTHCGNLTLLDSARMTVTGSLTISPGKSLTFSDNGEISISGDWINSGVFTPGTGTVKFIGVSPATVSAYGSNIATYSRSTFTRSMTALSDASPGPAGDNNSADIGIGFTFNYIGSNCTMAHICTNGWLSLNATGASSSVNSYLFTTSFPNMTIAPWWDNLNTDAAGIVSYKTEGTLPFRVFTAEWDSVLTFASSATSRISFQVKLFETTNVIEFHYGSLIAGTHNPSESASIGIEDVTGGSGHFIDATTGSITTGNPNLVSTINWPTVNYRFTPPIPTEIFQNVIVNKSGTYIDFNTNTVVNSTFSLMPGASFKVINGKSLTVGD